MLLNRCHALVHCTHNTVFSAANIHFQQLIAATEKIRSRDSSKKWRKYRNEAFVLKQLVNFKDRLKNSDCIEIEGSRELTSTLVSI